MIGTIINWNGKRGLILNTKGTYYFDTSSLKHPVKLGQVVTFNPTNISYRGHYYVNNVKEPVIEYEKPERTLPETMTLLDRYFRNTVNQVRFDQYVRAFEVFGHDKIALLNELNSLAATLKLDK